MCRLFPFVMEKSAFPTRDAIDKRNLFLLSGRAVSCCRHKSLHKKQVPTHQKSNFQILIICKNKLSKAELYKSNFVKKSRSATIYLHFKTLYIFSSTFLQFLFLFTISLFALNSIFLLQISSSVTFTYFFSVRVKPIQNVILKNEKKSVAKNIVESKKYFLTLVRLDLVVLENYT